MFSWFRRANGPRTVTTGPSAGASPLSPTTASRVDERNALAGLNDRLIAYIERVRKLESDNSALCRNLQEREESSVREAKAVQELYERELTSLRKLVDELAGEKAALQIETTKLKADFEDSEKRFSFLYC